MYNFTRVLSTTSALKIPKGTFMDGVLGKTTELATASLVPSANFCHIQAVKVPHFRNVTINSGGLTANVFPFTDGTPGGVVAMRISGKLVLNDNIDVTGRGLPGISTSEFGGGCSVEIKVLTPPIQVATQAIGVVAVPEPMVKRKLCCIRNCFRWVSN